MLVMKAQVTPPPKNNPCILPLPPQLCVGRWPGRLQRNSIWLINLSAGVIKECMQAHFLNLCMLGITEKCKISL